METLLGYNHCSSHKSYIRKKLTVKNLKIQTPEKFAVIILTVEQFGFMTE